MSNESLKHESEPQAEETKPAVETSDAELDEISGAKAVPLYGVIPT